MERDERSNYPCFVLFFFFLPIVLNRYRKWADENWVGEGRVKGKDVLG